MRLNAANNAQTRLVGDITSAATSFYVVDATVFPAAPFMISMDAEIMQVATVLGNLLSGITRAQEGTTAAAHVGDIPVENRWTAGMYASLALTEDVGAKTSLLTTIKTTIVAAINEIFNSLGTHKAETALKHITESGSNANGNYIRFDDGTQICGGSIGITTLIGGFNGGIPAILPASFINDDYVVTGSVLGSSSGGDIWSLRITAFSSSQLAIGINMNQATGWLGLAFITIGRWK